MARKRRDGFDYFVDQNDNVYNTYGYDDPGFEDDFQPIDRFQKKNKYTGEAAGNPQYINTSSVYTREQNPGTMEFSAIPGMGGLDPSSRPLGDQTMMFSNSYNDGQNPYVQQMYQQQQQMYQQQPQWDQQTELMNGMNTATYNQQNTQVYGAAPVKKVVKKTFVKQPGGNKGKFSPKHLAIAGILILVSIALIVVGVLFMTGVIAI